MLKRVIYLKLEKYTLNSLAPAFRRLGQSLFYTGVEMTKHNEHVDRLVPSLRAMPIHSNKVYPKLLSADWVAPNATVIGDVHLDTGSSLWHGTTLRGDTAKITIGKNAIIQDRVLAKSNDGGHPEINIGDNTFVGANTQLDACTLEDFAYIGMGATLHKNVTVESYGIVAAGSVVSEGTVVPSGQVFAGNPAKYLRDATQEEKHQISEYLIEMQQLGQIYCEETETTYREQIEAEEQKEFEDGMHPYYYYENKLQEVGLPLDAEDGEYIEHRVMTQYKMDVDDYDFEYAPLQEDYDEKTYNPYHQDFSRYPEIFKMYGENYDQYQKVKERFDTEKAGGQPGPHASETDAPKDQTPWKTRYNNFRHERSIQH
jgi:carbonic anhydrase/acetyltransferase-like protein (isoleucine patch superfamily)